MGDECTHMSLIYDGERSYSTFRCSKFFDSYRCIYGTLFIDNPYTIAGNLTFIDTVNGNNWNYESPSLHILIPEENIISIKVLPTDSENYSIGYDCTSNGKKVTFVWVMSREPKISETIEAQIAEIIKENFNTTELIEVIQHETFCEPRLDISELNKMWNPLKVKTQIESYSFDFNLAFKTTTSFSFPRIISVSELDVSFNLSKNTTKTFVSKGDHQ